MEEKRKKPRSALVSECVECPFREAVRCRARVGCTRTSPGVVQREQTRECYLVDPASSHMLVSKIKPCRSKSMPQ